MTIPVTYTSILNTFLARNSPTLMDIPTLLGVSYSRHVYCMHHQRHQGGNCIHFYKSKWKTESCGATVTFGMGLDCPNVRTIIHWEHHLTLIAIHRKLVVQEEMEGKQYVLCIILRKKSRVIMWTIL